LVGGAFVLAAHPVFARASVANDHIVVAERAAAPSPDDRRFGRASQWGVGIAGPLPVSYVAQHESPSYLDPARNPEGRKMESLSTMLFVPRLTVDAFVTDHVSVGLGASYSQYDEWFTTMSPEGTLTNQTSSTGINVNPRVGLVYGSAAGWGVWGRAG